MRQLKSDLSHTKMYGFVSADRRPWRAGRGGDGWKAGWGPQGLCVAEGWWWGAPGAPAKGGQRGGERRRALGVGQHTAGRPARLGSPGPGHQASGKALPLQGEGDGRSLMPWTAGKAQGPSAPVCSHTPHPMGQGCTQGFLPPAHAFWGPWLPSCAPSVSRKLQGTRETSSPPRGPWLTHSLGGSLRTQGFEGRAGACRVPPPAHCCPTLGRIPFRPSPGRVSVPPQPWARQLCQK